jgi:arginine decarboxylase
MFESKSFFIYAGKHNGETEKLSSFDNALINAGVDCYNLVKVSSIIPPFFRQNDVLDINKGSILYTAFASTTQKGEGIISAAIAVGLPMSEADIGVIMGYSCNDTEEEAIITVKKMVSQAMQNRNIPIKEILTTSISSPLSQNLYSTVVAGVALW